MNSRHKQLTDEQTYDRPRSKESSIQRYNHVTTNSTKRPRINERSCNDALTTLRTHGLKRVTANSTQRAEKRTTLLPFDARTAMSSRIQRSQTVADEAATVLQKRRISTVVDEAIRQK